MVCLRCNGRGVEAVGTTVYLDYLSDSRGMLRHDGETWLCGACACGDVPEVKYDVIRVRPATSVQPAWQLLIATGQTLEEANKHMTRYTGCATEMIVDERSTDAVMGDLFASV